MFQFQYRNKNQNFISNFVFQFIKKKRNGTLATRIDLDKDNEVNIGFLSVISRSDRNLGREIRDSNLKLKRFCEGNNFLFIDNVKV